MLTLGQFLIAVIALAHLCFFIWLWKGTPVRSSKRKRKRKEEQFRQSLSFGGYWDKIQSTKGQFGRW